MHITPKQFTLSFLRIFLALVVLVVAFQLWLDPFWAWRKNPPWLAWHGGHNFNLDVRMRAAKPLQLITRNPHTILIGSSRTYHGFDVSALPHAYNFGISGLRMREMEAFITYALSHTHAKHLVIGLDYFMFDAKHPTVAGFNPTVARPHYLFDAIPAAIFSADALSGARYALRGNKARDGVWDYQGHKARIPVGPDAIAEMLKAEHVNLGDVRLDAEAFAALSRLLAHAKSKGVRITLYLSPVHPLQFDLLRQDSALARFDEWREQVKKIASEQHTHLHDLIHHRFGDESQLSTRGSTRYWQDITHFTPEAGERLLRIMKVYTE